ncbi:hypothetical protein NQ117_23425 [Paenibacillus sp. SC116]|uniref:hypothetical protein n=1 Tax=Paenibacillus sp. SC116 TaxID=2968986 RepID=UPI00215A7EB7|nr:hypothetical protein [Paenibacillus sp. SC116]MCR8846638.1 hypothetical protein [Paenibacillus sp. SC116]
MTDITFDKPKSYSIVLFILWFNFLVSVLFLLLGTSVLIPYQQEIWAVFREGWVYGAFGISFEQYQAEFAYYFVLLIAPVLIAIGTLYASRKSSIALIFLLALLFITSVGRGSEVFVMIDFVSVACAASRSSRQYIRSVRLRGVADDCKGMIY